jgi:hypothetical protein
LGLTNPKDLERKEMQYRGQDEDNEAGVICTTFIIMASPKAGKLQLVMPL